MRGKQAPKRTILPDPKYNNLLIAKLINRIMERGKKTTAQKIVYSAFDYIDEKIKNKKIENLGEIKTAMEVFDQALKNISPAIEVKGRRIGGGNYQIPVPVRGNRRQFLAILWLMNSAKARKGMPMGQKLALELIDAFNNTGATIKKKEDVQKMAEANRAFSHFAR